MAGQMRAGSRRSTASSLLPILKPFSFRLSWLLDKGNESETEFPSQFSHSLSRSSSNLTIKGVSRSSVYTLIGDFTSVIDCS